MQKPALTVFESMFEYCKAIEIINNLLLLSFLWVKTLDHRNKKNILYNFYAIDFHDIIHRKHVKTGWPWKKNKFFKTGWPWKKTSFLTTDYSFLNVHVYNSYTWVQYRTFEENMSVNKFSSKSFVLTYLLYLCIHFFYLDTCLL